MLAGAGAQAWRRDRLPVYSSAFDWIEIAPRALNYYSFGAMGLGSSCALGFALGQPDRRVIVLDGDGSLLMNLGTLVTIGAAAPKNLVHFVCRNGTYEANGGHPIPQRDVDFTGLAQAAGYAHCAGVQGACRVRGGARHAAQAGRPDLRAPCTSRRARCRRSSTTASSTTRSCGPISAPRCADSRRRRRRYCTVGLLVSGIASR